MHATFEAISWFKCEALTLLKPLPDGCGSIRAAYEDLTIPSIDTYLEGLIIDFSHLHPSTICIAIIDLIGGSEDMIGLSVT